MLWRADLMTDLRDARIDPQHKNLKKWQIEAR
jgi:hypothetical protein